MMGVEPMSGEEVEIKISKASTGLNKTIKILKLKDIPNESKV